MEILASAEVHFPAYRALDDVRRMVIPFLQNGLATSDVLANLNCRLLYVPIVMPDHMHARYPARSRLRSDERIIECSPILDYEIFVEGTLQDQINEYLRGLQSSNNELHKLGITQPQIDAFEAMLERARMHLRPTPRVMN